MKPAVGQVWTDKARHHKPARQVRIDRIEQRGLWRVAWVSSRQGDEPWTPLVRRFIRLDRLPKRFTFHQEEN